MSNSDDKYVVFERWKSQADLDGTGVSHTQERALQLFDEEYWFRSPKARM